MSPQSASIEFASNFLNQKVEKIFPIANSGSNRKYFRIFTDKNLSFILTENDFVKENESFFYFSQIFSQNGTNVPKILTINSDKTVYLQEDIGDQSLLNELMQKGLTEEVYAMFEKSVLQLAQLQVSLKNKIDYHNCYDFQRFDRKVVQNDLFYFKNYFLDRLNLPYSKADFIDDVENLARKIEKLPSHYFLYRDFQSRNIFIQNEKLYFIDFQGGMQGFLGYDLVSILYQAKADLPQEWKNKLKKLYFDYFVEKEGIDSNQLEEGFRLAMVMRFFQVFGTYGLRGLVERKKHFLESLLLNVKNIEYLLEMKYLKEFPHLENLAKICVATETINKINQIIIE